jgi:hypothetical protein
MAGALEKIPDAVEPFLRDLISRCQDGDHRPTFLDIFCELQANRFKIFRAVGSQAGEQFLQSLL